MTLNKEQVLQIKELRGQNKTTKDIAIILGVSPRAISYWIKRLKASGYDMPVTTKKGKKALDLL